MFSRSSSEIEKLCTKIYAECTPIVTWKWDDRFQTLLTEIPAEQEREVMSVLDKYFEECWDEETINNAPGKIKSVAGDLGNVREGQLLFTSDPDQEALLVGALWPWQNGKKISLRFLIDIADIELGAGAPVSAGIQTPLAAA
jgi:hypothetical protein